MASSLELRVPFLDHKVVEFAWMLPPSLKINGGIGRVDIEKAVEDILPAEIVHRTKRVFRHHCPPGFGVNYPNSCGTPY